jgi:phosphoribosylaminoimidazolecarboxamide formyltransferase/IMP cyclohydrolase
LRGEGSNPLPFTVLNGSPGYINLLDALNAWQLVKELRDSLGLPAAASFKHVSPAGAAVGVPLSDQLHQAYAVGKVELSPVAAAYARARGGDSVSSFGDMAALSDVVDVPTAQLLRREVSDGVIAPGYEPEALKMLRRKKGGGYLVLQIDPDFEPPLLERREVFGITFEQRRNDLIPGAELFQEIVTDNTELPESAVRDLLVATLAVKYTQSNSVCLAYGGQVIGLGAGQQSRIHCTRSASSKAELWYLRQHPSVLGLALRPKLSRAERNNAIDRFLLEELTEAETQAWLEAFTEPPVRLTRDEKRLWLKSLQGVALSSDAYFPFRDNVDCASSSGVRYVVQAGGSNRDDEVIEAANEYGMVMAFANLRLFHH